MAQSLHGLYLSLVRGRAEARIPLVQFTTLGSEDLCTVRLTESGVAACHAGIRLADGSVQITDHGSEMGTLVNGKRIAPHQPVPLSPGDRITIGAIVYELAAA